MARICFVSYEIHPTTPGGAGVLIHHAIDLLTGAGHEALLLLDMDQASFARFAEHDRLTFAHPGRVRAFRVDDLCGDFAAPGGASVFQVKSLRFAHALGRLRAAHQIDLVEFFEYCGPGYYAFVQRLFEPSFAAGPVLASRVHGSVEVLERFGNGLVRDVDHFMQHSIERRGLALAETLLVPTRAYYDAYYRPLYGLGPERALVSTPPKQSLPRVTGRPAPGEPFSIAFVGRMFHLKGVDQLVHAAVALMKDRPGLDFTVDLIGYDSADGPLGSYEAYLRTLIPTGLRGRFVFHGQQAHGRIAELLGRALFAVFPNRVESFCYALHEVYDAGVPVIANALPAFTDFFTHEKNCLLYDGTTAGLTRAMERMIDDEGLRGRVRRPYGVAEEALGGVYESPRALMPLANGVEPVPTDPSLVMVVFGTAHADIGASAAVRSMRAQASREFRVLCLMPGASEQGGTLWWCGSPYTVRDWEGRVLDASELVTTSSLAQFRAGDVIHPSWLMLCRRALARRADLGFAGTWTEHNGVTEPGTLDLTPELTPFVDGQRLQRVLLRTTPGRPVGELLDASLGRLGHLGLIWETIGRVGPGVLLPRALVRVSVVAGPASDADLQSLILRHGGVFGDRMAIAASLMARRGRAPAGTAAPMMVEPSLASAPAATLEHKIAMADELGATLLAKMAVKKMAKRMMAPDRMNGEG
ncbi:MAG: glycosyltransferase [Tepidisphaera sp.]|nr:glycosyltransferase [Tepidisphaera sp.]